MLYQTAQGASVPALGFGTYLLTGDDCVTGVADAIALGYRHLDTAQSYSNEAQVAEGVRRSGVNRADLFIVSKLRPSNFGRAETSTLESLKELGTDYVDLMLLHWPADAPVVRSALEALGKLQAAGAVRHIGVSNFPTALVAEASEVATLLCNQVEYHPFLAQSQVLAQAADEDLLITAYRPLAKGLVRDEPLLQEIGAAYGKTPEQVTLRWLVQQPRVLTIPKSASAERRRANLDIFDFELSPADMTSISGLARGKRLVNPEGAPAWDA